MSFSLTPLGQLDVKYKRPSATTATFNQK
jgi:hypothetical protein